MQPRMRLSDDRMTRDPRAETKRHPAKALILALFLINGPLSGCTSEPFVDGRREAGSTRPIGPSTIHRVAICYNGRTTEAEAVLRLAESECAKTDRAPQYDGEDPFECAMNNPTRAFFRCVTPRG